MVHTRSIPATLTLICSCLAAACGSSGSPAAPSPSAASTPGVTALSISSAPPYLLVGQATTIAATATLSTGATQSVTPAWQSDSPSAAVDATGRIVGLSNGTATITASYQGATARATLRVYPSFGGGWAGDYNVTRCDASGDFGTAGFCSIFAVGQTFPINYTFVQNRDAVTGQLALGAVAGSLSGTIDGGGNFNASGSATSVTTGSVFTYRIGGFGASTDGQRLSAHWAESVTATGFSGNGYLELSTRIVTKTAAAGVLPMRTTGPFASIDEMWRAFSRR